ncbi:hypothetical protein BC829DRAFT_420383 [Chytridium lagenaria]|nr:hypothetical protein BC829DRAFT_420383 [Chytridium lagenaria]
MTIKASSRVRAYAPVGGSIPQFFFWVSTESIPQTPNTTDWLRTERHNTSERVSTDSIPQTPNTTDWLRTERHNTSERVSTDSIPQTPTTTDWLRTEHHNTAQSVTFGGVRSNSDYFWPFAAVYCWDYVVRPLIVAIMF